MAAIFPDRPFIGRRLTCPVCQDSAFFSTADLREMVGPVVCDNHVVVVEMVGLTTLLDIWGKDKNAHPDDFEDWSMTGGEHGN